MNRNFVVGLLVMIATSCAAPGPGQPVDTFDEHGVHLVAHARGQCSICDLYGRSRQFVVAVMTSSSLGAGAVISRRGDIVTNAHVMGDEQVAEVWTHDEHIYPVKLAAADAEEDLALLRVQPPELQWHPVAVNAGQLPEVGSEVYIIGHPLGLGWTVTRGIVSGIRRDGGRTQIQTDAAISPGNSGGPMLDAAGNLVGIVTSKFVGVGAENIAFARPASAVLRFLSANDRPELDESTESGGP